ncbi:PREDICTED: UDP-glucuronosyltransferase 2C1-like [Branchiostoma belcheri]|uniref:UDP-glucuronosyltransferase 2C1-like n=1 Tax=Branchiostoma belcheri TaxID=7741 RepID=A0A6P4YHI2_BRABE|nr:PREDICTED: UDP-glucuronosyltransferase 2C1-like [Branchiostoma belcheri]
MSTGYHLFLAVAAILSHHVQSADILVATLTFGSPWLDVAKIAEVLASRGHDVTVLAHASQKSDLMRKWPNFRYETFGDPGKPPSIKEVMKTVPPKAFSSTGLLDQVTAGKTVLFATLSLTEETLSDTQLLRKLKNSHYDVVLTSPSVSSGPLVAQYLDLPLVCITRSLPSGQDIRATGVPNPLAYVPTVSSGLSDKMTFFQRVKNVLVYFVATTVGQMVLDKTFDDIAKRTIGDNYTMSAALARTDVWLYDSDLMFDFPKPMMPNMVSIHGHMAERVKPLTEELEKFMQSSGEDGIVLVTFGSMIAAMPAEKADMLAAAFARLPQKVVWRYAGTPPPSLGTNTRTMEWVPQSDLLAHPKTRAFVSHCGFNGVAEAMYHGVPVVGMPLWTDAYDNIARIVARGMAVSLDIHTVTSEEVYQAITTVISDPSEEALSDTQLLRKLKNSHYDVVLTYPSVSCGPLVAQYLDLPLVCTTRSLPTGQDIRATGVPNPLAYVPTVSSGLSDKMTFLQRVKNVLVYFVATTMAQVVFDKIFDDMAQRTIGGNYTMSAALARTDVWLYQSDLMFDFPKPMMPNMVSIAGHMGEGVKPLNEELEKFMQSSGDDGVVLVTFGSMIAAMPAEKADMLAAAFARLPQKVVWRYAGTPPPSLGTNTKTMEWVPQSDLLAEAMYHGVPVVGMPLVTDSHDNIARIVARGMAVSLDIHTSTSEEVYQAITTVISDPRYKEKASKVSTHLRDQPQSPMERAVWWIEHVIKHGGLPHLRSRAAELPFYQYYLLDVMALILAVISAVLLSCWKCCSFACGMCKRGKTNIKLKSH